LYDSKTPNPNRLSEDHLGGSGTSATTSATARGARNQAVVERKEFVRSNDSNTFERNTALRTTAPRQTAPRTTARRRTSSFAAFGAAAALVATLGLAGEARGRAPQDETPVVGRAASQQVFVPAGHEAPSAGREIRGGEASYYHDSLAGNPTASETPYRPAALTAAHQTLPLGTRVRVTAADSGRSVIVEVNDRGPFAKNRVIDLSRAAAQQIGMIRRGHTTVQLEVIG
jgi:rare lipoprotein A